MSITRPTNARTHLRDLARLLRPALRVGLPEHGLVVAARRKHMPFRRHGHGHYGLLVPDLPDGLRPDVGAGLLPQPEGGCLLLLDVPEADLHVVCVLSDQRSDVFKAYPAINKATRANHAPSRPRSRPPRG